MFEKLKFFSSEKLEKYSYQRLINEHDIEENFCCPRPKSDSCFVFFITLVVVAGVFSLMHLCYNRDDNILHFLAVISFSCSLIFLGMLSHQIVKFVQKCILSEGALRKRIITSFKSELYEWKLYAAVIISLLLIGNFKNHFTECDKILCNYLIIGVMSITILLILVTYLNEPQHEVCTIGHSLAMSYYFGFLKHCLPAGYDSSSPDIANRMEAYEDKHNSLKFRLKKLFILIPESCNVSGSLSDFNKNDDNFESLGPNGELISHGINRCGVQSRTYKNTVYKLTDNENSQSFYCAVEVATPLQTFYEMLHDGNTNANIGLKQLNIQRKNFVKSLLKVLYKNPDVGMHCEIIEFNDRNEDGDRVKLSEIIVNRINQKKIENFIPLTVSECEMDS